MLPTVLRSSHIFVVVVQFPALARIFRIPTADSINIHHIISIVRLRRFSHMNTSSSRVVVIPRAHRSLTHLTRSPIYTRNSPEHFCHRVSRYSSRSLLTTPLSLSRRI